MKYQARPVLVDAFIITAVGPVLPDGPMGSLALTLENGDNVAATFEMIVRHTPTEGDYWVIQEDGYVYVNPKDVFERKYALISGAA